MSSYIWAISAIVRPAQAILQERADDAEAVEMLVEGDPFKEENANLQGKLSTLAPADLRDPQQTWLNNRAFAAYPFSHFRTTRNLLAECQS